MFMLCIVGYQKMKGELALLREVGTPIFIVFDGILYCGLCSEMGVIMKKKWEREGGERARILTVRKLCNYDLTD